MDYQTVSSNIFFLTDGDIFTRSGINYYHNNHKWSVDNPHVMKQRRFQQRFSVNLCAGNFDSLLISCMYYISFLNHVIYRISQWTHLWYPRRYFHKFSSIDAK